MTVSASISILVHCCWTWLLVHAVWSSSCSFLFKGWLFKSSACLENRSEAWNKGSVYKCWCNRLRNWDSQTGHLNLFRPVFPPNYLHKKTYFHVWISKFPIFTKNRFLKNFFKSQRKLKNLKTLWWSFKKTFYIFCIQSAKNRQNPKKTTAKSQ